MTYDWKNYGSLEKFDKLNVHKDIADWLYLEYSLKDKRILDLGGGTGIQLSYMDDSNYLLNIDSSLEAVLYGNEKHIDVDNMCLDISTQKIPVCRNFFDFVFSIQTLEHINEYSIDFVLSEINRVLRPGGHFFLSVAVQDNIEDKSHVNLRNRAWWLKKIEKYFIEEKREKREYDWQYFFLKKTNTTDN